LISLILNPPDYNPKHCPLMKLLKLLAVFSILFISYLSSYAQVNDTLFNDLNKVIADKEHYVAEKQSHIRNLRGQLSKAKTLPERYVIYEKLYNANKTFSFDSAYSNAKQLQAVAAQLRNPVLMASAKMKMSFTLISSGMFKETLENLNQIDLKNLSNNDKVEYYFLKARSYFDLSDFNRNTDYTAIYNPKGIECIDSGLMISKVNSYNYLSLGGLKDLRTGDFASGIKHYTQLLKTPNLTPHQYAVNACCLSYIYETQRNEEKEVELLIKAAIMDIKSATKETVAIYKLADYAYKKGDLQNAYTYIRLAMDEATFYGARHRQVQISSILPIIEGQRISTIEHQRKLLFIYSALITLLIIFVVVFAVIIFRQLKKLRIADEIIKKTNVSLQQSNHELDELNKKLSVANKIKDEYIGFYFNTNSVYIEKLENFKKSLDKKLSSKRYEDAQLTVQSLNLETERHELFDTFDKVFLRLFPDFIAKFNALFKPEDNFIPPKGQLLNTELRIFALIRMGIHDNDRISKILGYSVNTIYAYKNRIKTKSIIPNDEFEEKIMQIEAV
jgi:DNA-binding CsgD family transcriptional regulator/cell division protein FtsL